jgi:hypothetical protein
MPNPRIEIRCAACRKPVASCSRLALRSALKNLAFIILSGTTPEALIEKAEVQGDILCSECLTIRQQSLSR